MSEKHSRSPYRPTRHQLRPRPKSIYMIHVNWGFRTSFSAVEQPYLPALDGVTNCSPGHFVGFVVLCHTFSQTADCPVAFRRSQHTISTLIERFRCRVYYSLSVRHDIGEHGTDQSEFAVGVYVCLET